MKGKPDSVLVYLPGSETETGELFITACSSSHGHPSILPNNMRNFDTYIAPRKNALMLHVYFGRSSKGTVHPHANTQSSVGLQILFVVDALILAVLCINITEAQ